MPRSRVYVVTERVLKAYRMKLGSSYCCAVCGRPFELYDLVFSTPSRAKSKMKRYHVKCYESLLG